MSNGADNAHALDVALAQLRVGAPFTQEWELRTALAKHIGVAPLPRPESGMIMEAGVPILVIDASLTPDEAFRRRPLAVALFAPLFGPLR